MVGKRNQSCKIKFFTELENHAETVFYLPHLYSNKSNIMTHNRRSKANVMNKLWRTIMKMKKELEALSYLNIEPRLIDLNRGLVMLILCF